MTKTNRFTLIATILLGILLYTVLRFAHDLNLASLFCDCLVLMQAGKVIRKGTVKEVVQESVLGTVYPGNIHIDTHPIHGQPMVLPLAKRNDIDQEGDSA